VRNATLLSRRVIFFDHHVVTHLIIARCGAIPANSADVMFIWHRLCKLTARMNDNEIQNKIEALLAGFITDVQQSRISEFMLATCRELGIEP